MTSTLIVSNQFDILKYLKDERIICAKSNKLTKDQIKTLQDPNNNILEACDYDEFSFQQGFNNYIFDIEDEKVFHNMKFSQIGKFKATFYWIFKNTDHFDLFELIIGKIVGGLDDNLKPIKLKARKIFPKYNRYKDYLEKIFIDIKSQILDIKTNIVITEIMPLDTPQELIAILLDAQKQQIIPELLSIKSNRYFYGFECEDAFVFRINKSLHYVLKNYTHNADDYDSSLDQLEHDYSHLRTKAHHFLGENMPAKDLDYEDLGEDLLIIDEYKYYKYMYIAFYLDHLHRSCLIYHATQDKLINKIGKDFISNLSNIYFRFDFDDKSTPLKYHSSIDKKLIAIEKNINAIYYPEIYALFKTYPEPIDIEKITIHANAYRKYYQLPEKQSKSNKKQDTLVKAIKTINDGFAKTASSLDKIKYTFPLTLIQIDKKVRPHRFVLSNTLKNPIINISQDSLEGFFLLTTDKNKIDEANGVFLNIKGRLEQIHEKYSKEESINRVDFADMCPYIIETIVNELPKRETIDNFEEHIINQYTGKAYGELYSRIKALKQMHSVKTTGFDDDMNPKTKRKKGSNNADLPQTEDQKNDHDLGVEDVLDFEEDFSAEDEIYVGGLVSEFKAILFEVYKDTNKDRLKTGKIIEEMEEFLRNSLSKKKEQ